MKNGKRLTQKHAKWLLDHQQFDKIPMSFKDGSQAGTFTPEVNGMTIDEYNHVAALWGTMDNNGSFYIALRSIKDGTAKKISDEDLLKEMEITKKLIS